MRMQLLASQDALAASQAECDANARKVTELVGHNLSLSLGLDEANKILNELFGAAK